MASGSETAGLSSAQAASAVSAAADSMAPADYEQVAAEATDDEDVHFHVTSADSLAEAYGRVFQWESQVSLHASLSAALPVETSVLGRQSLEERVMTLLEDLAHTMHRLRLLEEEVADHRRFALELHSSLTDLTDQVHRHDISRREISEAVISLQQRFRAHVGVTRSSRSPRTPP